MITIMCVDDNKDTLVILEILLSAETDFKVLRSSLETTCLMQELETYSPDILLLDIRMQGTDPLILINEIRDSFPKIHVIVYSGFSDSKLIRDAEQAGASGYVIKGLSHDDLMSTIRKVSDGKHVFPIEENWQYAGGII